MKTYLEAFPKKYSSKEIAVGNSKEEEINLLRKSGEINERSKFLKEIEEEVNAMKREEEEKKRK